MTTKQRVAYACGALVVTMVVFHRQASAAEEFSPADVERSLAGVPGPVAVAASPRRSHETDVWWSLVRATARTGRNVVKVPALTSAGQLEGPVAAICARAGARALMVLESPGPVEPRSFARVWRCDGVALDRVPSVAYSAPTRNAGTAVMVLGGGTVALAGLWAGGLFLADAFCPVGSVGLSDFDRCRNKPSYLGPGLTLVGGLALMFAGSRIQAQAGPQAAPAPGRSSSQTVAVPFASESGGGLALLGRF